MTYPIIRTIAAMLLLCSLFFQVPAQTMQVIYEESRTQSETSKEGLEPWMRQVLENNNNSHLWQLTYLEGRSLYKTAGDKQSTKTVNNFHEKYKVYRDMGAHEVLKVSPMLSGDFLVQATPDQIDAKWQLVPGTKQIGDYTCQKATTIRPDTGAEVTAWYTAQIPSPTGPDVYWGLPGLILHVDIVGKNSTTHITALSVVYDSDEALYPEKPDFGKPITYGDYQKIVKKEKSGIAMFSDPFGQ